MKVKKHLKILTKKDLVKKNQNTYLKMRRKSHFRKKLNRHNKMLLKISKTNIKTT